MDNEKIREISDLYNSAEALIKKAEHAQHDITIPAINELRYAGQHLLRHLVPGQSRLTHPDDDDDKDESELDSAIKHCKRAQYDAAEGPVLFFMKQIKDFKEDYKNEVIGDAWPDYISSMSKVDDINREWQNISQLSRQRHADAFGTHFNELAKIATELPYVREDLNKIIKRKIKEERNALFTFFFAAAGTIIGIIALIAG